MDENGFCRTVMAIIKILVVGWAGGYGSLRIISVKRNGVKIISK